MTVSDLIVGVGLFGPVVVVCALMAFDAVRSIAGIRGSYDDVDEVDRTPKWLVALMCAGALAIADPVVAAVGYHAPLAMLARVALGGAIAGAIAGRIMAIGDGAAMMLIGLVWPLAIVVGYAIHIGVLCVVLGAI